MRQAAYRSVKIERESGIVSAEEEGFSMRTLLLLSLVLNVWLGFAVVRLENYHYANQLGMCANSASPQAAPTREICLNRQHTRTSPWWHIYYALKDEASLL